MGRGPFAATALDMLGAASDPDLAASCSSQSELSAILQESKSLVPPLEAVCWNVA